MTKKNKHDPSTPFSPRTLVIDVILDLCMSFKKKKKNPTLVSPYML